MTTTTSIPPSAAVGDALTVAGEGPRRRLRWRHLWLVPGLAIAIFANQLGNANGVGILALIAFGIAPDVPRLLGTAGVPIHNVLHQPALPVLAAALATTAFVTIDAPAVLLVGALVWLGHVVAGRGVGDVPRSTQVASHT
jgi:hypothetical protein